jgi:hypothetical protein
MASSLSRSSGFEFNSSLLSFPGIEGLGFNSSLLSYPCLGFRVQLIPALLSWYRGFRVQLIPALLSSVHSHPSESIPWRVGLRRFIEKKRQERQHETLYHEWCVRAKPPVKPRSRPDTTTSGFPASTSVTRILSPPGSSSSSLGMPVGRQPPPPRGPGATNSTALQYAFIVSNFWYR